MKRLQFLRTEPQNVSVSNALAQSGFCYHLLERDPSEGTFRSYEEGVIAARHYEREPQCMELPDRLVQSPEFHSLALPRPEVEIRLARFREPE
jgi:hypothetical protein